MVSPDENPSFVGVKTSSPHTESPCGELLQFAKPPHFRFPASSL